MSNFELLESDNLRAKIRVIGVGGGGGNAVNNMIMSGMEGVDFVVVNTDSQDLNRSMAPRRFQLGAELTKGLGAGAKPEVGREAALEDRERLAEMVQGCDMVFIAAGMGGGTGTGAAPVIAQVAKEMGALTVAVVTRPFQFEANARRRRAEEGIENLRQCVDTLITIPNQRLVSMANEKTTLKEAFQMADRVLYQAVKGVSDLINFQGLVNVDFADVRTIMQDKGIALMGVGQAAGDDRMMKAASMAVNSPLLDEVSLSGATSVLVNITSSSSVTMLEISEASTMISEEAAEDANVIWGWVIDEDMENEVRVTVIATGFEEQWLESNRGLPRAGRGLGGAPAASAPAPRAGISGRAPSGQQQRGRSATPAGKPSGQGLSGRNQRTTQTSGQAQGYGRGEGYDVKPVNQGTSFFKPKR